MKSIEIPILNNEYKVVVCMGASKEVYELLKQYSYNITQADVDNCLKDRRGCCFMRNQLHPVIWLNKNAPANDAIGTIAHEAVHAIVHIFNFIDETSYDEVFAHSVGAVVRETLTGFRILKNGKANKKKSK